MRYEAEGFGVGELSVQDGRVVWHDLPRPDLSLRPERSLPEIPVVTVSGNGARVRADSVTSSIVARLQAFFRGEDVSFADVELDLEFETPFRSALAVALRAVPRGRSSPTVSSRRSPGVPGRRAPQGASARTIG